MALWLVHSTSARIVEVGDLAGVVVFCVPNFTSNKGHHKMDSPSLLLCCKFLEVDYPHAWRKSS